MSAEQGIIEDAPEGGVSVSIDELKAELEQAKASATQQYSLKNYNAAAEFYSEAAELSDQINGEMSLDNADLLYQYGRCLYHVAVSNSDVLGGKVAGGEEPKRKKRKTAHAEGSSAGAEKEGLIGAAMDGDNPSSVKKEETASANPFFQITGDENWTDSEEEEEDGEADQQAEEEEDDFAVAYEILDIARILFSRKLEQATEASDDEKKFKERLADIYDLQAEISLENERFQDAINDTREALSLKLRLFPTESSLIAEAHFKLSLALEFASVTTAGGEEDDPNKPQVVDEGMRSEAALQMERAIASCNARIAKEQEGLDSLPEAKKAEQLKSIADVKEMVVDMQQRLVDLRNPAASLRGDGGNLLDSDLGGEAIRGVLGAMLGESREGQKAIVEDATRNANDLSGAIKRKKPKAEPEYEGKGKKRAADAEETVADGAPKKLRS